VKLKAGLKQKNVRQKNMSQSLWRPIFLPDIFLLSSALMPTIAVLVGCATIRDLICQAGSRLRDHSRSVVINQQNHH
jgi:hypothetical protein